MARTGSAGILTGTLSIATLCTAIEGVATRKDSVSCPPFSGLRLI
jgi:hypothetical protein